MNRYRTTELFRIILWDVNILGERYRISRLPDNGTVVDPTLTPEYETNEYHTVSRKDAEIEKRKQSKENTELRLP